MQKPLILMMAAAAALTGIVIGFAATRAGRAPLAGARAHSHSFHAGNASLRETAAKETDLPQDAQPSDADLVIQFANNPQPAPAFLMTDLAGKPVSTADWKGKVVILNFWATWCPPCQAEIPMLIDLANRYKDKLEIVGVSVDDSTPAEVEDFVKQMGMNYPIVMANAALVQEYGGVPALPTAFVINEDTKVVQKHVGLFPETLYDQEVRALLHMSVDAKIETFEDRGQIFLKNAALATDLPGVDLKGLTPEQKKAVLKELNTKTCTCGCRLTLAQCRIVDSPCMTSKKLANEVVKQILSNSSSPNTTVRPTTAPRNATPHALETARTLPGPTGQ